MRVSFRLLDVFTEVPFAGNQLCVVSEAAPELTTGQMQTIAREINFSETTFVTAVRDDGYDIRIFTPQDELPFAGHPTLGTAFTLVAEGRLTSPLVQTSLAGEVTVEVDAHAGTARMQQLPPTFGPPFEDRVSVARAAGLTEEDLVHDLPIRIVSTGLAHLMVPVRDEAALRKVVRDGGGCAAVCEAAGAESLYLFVVRGDGDVMARMFDRWDSIGEDPATGSAAGPLGAYLCAEQRAGMPGAITVAQGEMVGRPSFLRVEASQGAAGWSIVVSGGVQIVGEGSLEL